jgi:acyl-coenzyme A synthetase/AMP-(fatty) acid ligase
MAKAVAERIVAHARSNPGRLAVIHNGCAYDYRTFASRIAIARAAFARQDLDRDRVAMLCVHDIFDAWVLGLALRELGVTTVQGRSLEDVETLGLSAVQLISTEAEADLWPGLASAAGAGSTVLLTPTDLFAGAGRRTIDLGAPASGPSGGHILLTSGTTGTYKKVLIDPACEAYRSDLCANRYEIDPGSRVNVFGFGGWTAVGYHLPICAWRLGGGVIIHQAPDAHRSLADPTPTHAFVQPLLLAKLLATASDLPPRNDDMGLIVTAGALSLAQWREAHERLTRDVRTSIGSTETAGFAVTRIEVPEDLQWHRIHPPGRVQVVDDQDRPLAAGKTGAVRVRATGVLGYLDDPAASRAFFRDGYFYTGDLGILREDGRLSLQGRVTEVINVLGSKYGALPIESALQDALGAEAVCVFSTSGENGEDFHVAIQLGRTVGAAELKSALLAALPPGVAQAQVHSVEEIPRNHMGKIERAALIAQFAPREAAPEGQS